MEHLEHAGELSARDQRHGAIGLEALSREERAPSKLAEGAKRGDRLHAASNQGATRKALIYWQAVVRDGGRLEARTCRRHQRPVFLVEHQDVGGVDCEPDRKSVV